MLLMLVVLAVFAGNAAPQLGASREESAGLVQSQISYEAFMALEPQFRVVRFREVNAETKAMLMRTHAQRWLDNNRARLAPGQIKLVQETIDFISPKVYTHPEHPEIVRRTTELAGKLMCDLRASDVLTAFSPSQAPTRRNWFDDLWTWFTDCIIG